MLMLTMLIDTMVWPESLWKQSMPIRMHSCVCVCVCMCVCVCVCLCVCVCVCVREGSTARLQIPICQATPSTCRIFHKKWIPHDYKFLFPSLVSFWNSRLAPIICLLHCITAATCTCYSILTCCTTSHVVCVCLRACVRACVCMCVCVYV